MRDSYSLSDIRQMLRLPAAVTHSVLSCPTNRDIFIKMLVEATLVSMTDEEQVLLLQLLLQHSDLLLLDNQPVDKLLVDFLSADTPPLSLLPIMQCLLLKWHAHLAKANSLHSTALASSGLHRESPPSVLATLFSEHFQRGHRAQRERAAAGARLASLRSALQQVEGHALAATAGLLTTSSSPAPSCTASHGCILPRRVATQEQLPPCKLSGGKRPRPATSDSTQGGDGGDSLARGEIPTAAPDLAEKSTTTAPRSHAATASTGAAITTTTEASGDDGGDGDGGDGGGAVVPGISCASSALQESSVRSERHGGATVPSPSPAASSRSSAAKKELSALLLSLRDAAPVFITGDTAKNLARSLSDKMDTAFDLACSPLLLAVSSRGGGGGAGAVGDVLQEACLFYALAVKALRLLDVGAVADEVFGELVELQLDGQHLEDRAAAGAAASRRGGGGGGSVTGALSLAVLFFLSGVVQARLRGQLARSAAPRRLMRAVEVCCERLPAHTVSCVLLPCLLPPPLLACATAAAEGRTSGVTEEATNSKHLNELVNRTLRQNLLLPPFVNQLFEMLFAQPHALTVETDVSATSLALCGLVPGAGPEQEAGGWERGESVVQAGRFLCAVTALMQQKTLQQCAEQCEEQRGGLHGLIPGHTASPTPTPSLPTSLRLKQTCLPLADMDCLKCLSSMLIPLLSAKGKGVLDAGAVQLLLFRLDEASSLTPSVAQSPLTANLLHALVNANKNSGQRLLKDCLEELHAILSRAPKSVVARAALAEVSKLLRYQVVTTAS